jgi:hypothetical protein
MMDIELFLKTTGFVQMKTVIDGPYPMYSGHGFIIIVAPNLVVQQGYYQNEKLIFFGDPFDMEIKTIEQLYTLFEPIIFTTQLVEIMKSHGFNRNDLNCQWKRSDYIVTYTYNNLRINNVKIDLFTVNDVLNELNIV